MGGIATSPLRSWGSPKEGTKIKNRYTNPASSGARKLAELLRHPCLVGGPQQRGEKSKIATSALLFRGPANWRKCYVTLAFWGFPKRGVKNQKRLHLLCLLGGGGPQKRGQKSKKATSTLPSVGPISLWNGYFTPEFSGVSRKGDKIRNVYIIGAFLGFPKWRERHW